VNRADHAAPIARFLSRLLHRSPLTQAEQIALLSLKGPISRHAAHRDVVSPGERVEHSCLIVDGLAGRFDQMANGKRQITALHLPGDMCDLHSVVVPTASWSITALSDVTVMQVEHKKLRELVESYPGIAMAFWRDAVADGSHLVKWVGNLGRKGAAARVAHIFCEIGMRMESAGLGERRSFNFPVTQEQLADAAGLTSVHTNRVLQELRGRNLLTFRAGKVEILDWDAFAREAEFDPAYLILRWPGEPEKSA
jgi:CRP-like cAMP-binding protein